MQHDAIVLHDATRSHDVTILHVTRESSVSVDTGSSCSYMCSRAVGGLVPAGPVWGHSDLGRSMGPAKQRCPVSLASSSHHSWCYDLLLVLNPQTTSKTRLLLVLLLFLC